jgi:hypothetical protein
MFVISKCSSKLSQHVACFRTRETITFAGSSANERAALTFRTENLRDRGSLPTLMNNLSLALLVPGYAAITTMCFDIERSGPPRRSRHLSAPLPSAASAARDRSRRATKPSRNHFRCPNVLQAAPRTSNAPTASKRLFMSPQAKVYVGSEMVRLSGVDRK